MGAGHPGAQMNYGNHQFFQEYVDDYDDDDDGQQQVDENGDPIRSPEEVKNIINSIPSFKFEEKKEIS